MKRLALLVIAMMGLFFTSCKPDPEGNENNGNNGGEANKVKISCTIPINKDTRSDFTGLFEDGVINWGDGRECVYLAIPGDEPKVVELEGYCDGYKPEIEFIAYVDENLLTAGESYDIWYFGHSQQLDEPYVSLVNGNKIEGSIAKQTGRLEDLGYSHIASTSVKAVMENGEVRLPLVGSLKNRMAIALVDLYAMTELKGTAVNTDYALEYNLETGRYEFNVIEDANATIEIEDALYGISYLALLPNENNKVVLEGDKYGRDYEYTFYTGIKENKIYHRIDHDENITCLIWEGDSLPYGFINGYEYVDLGLPSGIKWAKHNYGYTKEVPEGTTSEYSAAKFSSTWGSQWFRPSESLFLELKENCEWEWVSQNGIDGYKVTGPNGVYIFMPVGTYTTSTASVTGISGTGKRYYIKNYFKVDSSGYYATTTRTQCWESYPSVQLPDIVGYSYRPVVE